MKIKTIVHDDPKEFDKQVNKALKKGYVLGHRGTLPGATLVAHYAQLVRLDPAPERSPGLPDPMAAVRAIREMCLATSVIDCTDGKCPLEGWCGQLEKGGDPTDWVLPGEEAAL